MRLTLQGLVQASEDSSGKKRLFFPDADQEKIIHDGFVKCFSGLFTVVAGGQENLSLGDIADVRGFFIRAAGDFDMKADGGTTRKIRKGSSTATSTRVLAEEQVASLTILAPDGNTAVSGTYCVWGDPAA